MAMLRRLLVLMLVIGAGAAGYALWQRRHGERLPDIPEWPPFPEDPRARSATSEQATGEQASSATAPAAAASSAVASAVTWVEPVDGQCPDGFPVKLKLSSGIFHVPGGRSYDRTSPDRCYTSVEAATADGYRAAKA